MHSGGYADTREGTNRNGFQTQDAKSPALGRAFQWAISDQLP